MSDAAPPALCQLCRSLNLRAETFVDGAWRYPTSLEYKEAYHPRIKGPTKILDQYYVPNERLRHDQDYTDDELATKLESPELKYYQDLDGDIERPWKEKILGLLAEIQARATQCAFCRVVAEAARLTASSNGIKYRHVRGDVECSICFRYDENGRGTLSVDPTWPPKPCKYGRYSCALRIGLAGVGLLPICDRSDLSWLNGRPCGPQIDFNRVKSWIQTCESKHKACGEQDWHANFRSMEGKLRLVDVHKMCLVDGSMEDRYLALSYVWGQASMFRVTSDLVQDLYSPGALQAVWNDMSQTIRDAIEVVRNAGERYLWTDAISIVQDDALDKAGLIKHMDTVYAKALVTIVALTGTDANAGLPGVRPNTRSPSPEIVRVGPQLSLLLDLENLADTMFHCPWVQRAWTYQEGALSARTLLFAHDVVRFSCCCTTWSENVTCPSESAAPPWPYNRRPVFDFRSNMNLSQQDLITGLDDSDDATAQGKLLETWASVIRTISRRDLTYEGDILFAAAGILGLLRKQLHTRGLYGLPECALEHFLAWTAWRPGKLRRRRDIAQGTIYPSWTWAGWVGPTYVRSSLRNAKACESQFDLISWSGSEGASSQSVALHSETARDSQQETEVIESTSSRNLETSLELLEDLELPLLHFRTRIARYSVVRDAELPKWVAGLQLAFEGEVCVSSGGAAEKDIVGGVVLDSSAVMQDQDKLTATFAIISSALYRIDHEEFDREIDRSAIGTLHYRVLALERSNDGTFERIGCGAISQEAFDRGDWNWETVTLK